jgi:hypothetical protein
MVAATGTRLIATAYTRKYQGMTPYLTAGMVSGNITGAKPNTMNARKMIFHDQNKP